MYVWKYIILHSVLSDSEVHVQRKALQSMSAGKKNIDIYVSHWFCLGLHNSEQLLKLVTLLLFLKTEKNEHLDPTEKLNSD